jgi:hypothetical protein
MWWSTLTQNEISSDAPCASEHLTINQTKCSLLSRMPDMKQAAHKHSPSRRSARGTHQHALKPSSFLDPTKATFPLALPAPFKTSALKLLVGMKAMFRYYLWRFIGVLSCGSGRFFSIFPLLHQDVKNNYVHDARASFGASKDLQ